MNNICVMTVHLLGQEALWSSVLQAFSGIIFWMISYKRQFLINLAQQLIRSASCD